MNGMHLIVKQLHSVSVNVGGLHLDVRQLQSGSSRRIRYEVLHPYKARYSRDFYDLILGF